MNVLLAGGAGHFTELMINKLNKEGHRVYILTGKNHKHSSYKNVFETYRFPYDNENIREIFESVNPDIILFMGAFDTNFDWAKGKQTSVDYSSGLLNMLISFAALPRQARFIYLSSHEIFEESCDDDITEDQITSAKSIKSMSLALGEQMCHNYQAAFQKDIMVLRLDHMYSIPRNKNAIRNFYVHFCLEAFQHGSITVNSNKRFSMLYVFDAIEFIYKIMTSRDHKYSLYNISSMREFTELELAELIRDALDGKLEIKDNRSYQMDRLVLSAARYDEEFGINIFHQPEEVVKKTLDTMAAHRNDYLEVAEKEPGFWAKMFGLVRRLPNFLISYAEAIVFFIPFFLFNNYVGESHYFSKLDIYLIYVLIFAIIYGQQLATFAAILATVGYCIRAMYTRSGIDVLVDYNTYIWIAQLFIMGFVVGYLRDRINIIQDDNQKELEHLTTQLEDIQDINNSNVRSKNILETEVIVQSQSIGTVYEITSSLEQYEPEEVLFYAAGVLGRLMESEEVAIYSVANSSYARLFSATSPNARKMGNSINYVEMTEMYGALQERRVFINKNMDEKYPLMANAIYSENEMQLILMVWGIPWERMTLAQANILTVIGYLIQNAVIRANRFIDVLKNERYIEGTNILELNAFRSLVKAYVNAYHKGLAEYTLLTVNTGGEDQKEIAAKLKTKIRLTDSIGNLEDGKLYVLLTNTPKTDAAFVINRFRESGYESTIWEEAVV